MAQCLLIEGTVLQLAQVDDDWLPPRLPMHAAALQELVDAMLQVRVEKRPLPAELLAFPIFRYASLCSVRYECPMQCSK
jgi:hypothetical protein